jgi:predicted DNA-binding transcriptional regulator YafY
MTKKKQPALTFTEEEIEAILTGLCTLLEDEDSEMYAAALDASDKIIGKLPEPGGLLPGVSSADPADRSHFAASIAAAVAGERKLRLRYRDAKGNDSQRIVWPIFGGGVDGGSVAAWCERRRDFRNFRIDRIQSVEILDRYPKRRQLLLIQFQVFENDNSWY